MKNIVSVREGREKRSRAGRPPLGKDALSATVMVHLTDADKAALDKKSKQAKTTMGAWTRGLILDDLGKG